MVKITTNMFGRRKKLFGTKARHAVQALAPEEALSSK